LFCFLKQIIGRLSADGDCQMADTDYRPIIGAPLVSVQTFSQQNLGVTIVQSKCGLSSRVHWIDAGHVLVAWVSCG